MSQSNDQLVTRLEALLASLESGDAETVAAAMDDTVREFSEADRPWADPRILALYRACQSRAKELLASLHAELGRNATSRRASSAYGESP